MEKVKLFEFENEQAFEDYLISTYFIGWSLFQDLIVSVPHKTIGLKVGRDIVAAAKISKTRDGELYIHCFLVRDEYINNGYGTLLFNLILKNYKNHEGIRLLYADGALGFWLKHGFHFDEDINFLIR